MKLTKTRLFKRILIILSSIIAVLIIAGILVVVFFPRDKIISIVTEDVKNILEKKIVIKSININFNGVILKDIALMDLDTKHDTPSDDIQKKESDTEKKKKEPIIKAEEIRLGFSFWSLLNEEFVINQVAIIKPQLQLQINKEGKTNLDDLIKKIKEAGKDGSSTKIENIKISDALFTIKTEAKDYLIFNGAHTISTTIEMKENTAVIDQFKLTLSENRGEISASFNLNLKNTEISEGKVTVKNLNLQWIYDIKGTNLPYYDINAELTPFSMKDNTIDARVKGSSSLKGIRHKMYVEAFTRVNIKKETVLISDAQANINTSETALQKIYFNLNGNLFELVIPKSSVNFSDIKPIATVIPLKLYGGYTGSFYYRYGKISANGKLSNLIYDLNEKYLTGLSTDISLKNNIFKKQNIDCRIWGQPATISFASTDGDLDKIFLNINFDTFTYKSNPKDNSPVDLNIDLGFKVLGKINMKKLEYNDYNFFKITSDYSIANNMLRFSKARSTFLNGNIYMNGSISLRRDPVVSSALTFTGIKLQSIAQLHKKIKGRVFGTLKGQAKISFHLNKEILKDMTGHLNLQAVNGKIVDTGIQDGLGIFLTELKYKLKDLEFNTIYGNVSLNKTDYKINSFVFNSEHIRMKLEGIINYELFAKNLKMNLEFDQYFIQDMPAAVRITLRKWLNGKWYIVPFTINGDITKSKNISQKK